MKNQGRRRGFQKAQFSFFQKSLRRAGIHQQVEAVQCLGVAAEVLAERFGEGAGTHVTPRHVKGRALTLEVAHPAVSEEIRQQEEAIISEINKRMGRPEVVRIQFALPSTGSQPSE